MNPQHARTVTIGDKASPPWAEIAFDVKREAAVHRMSPVMVAARRGLLSRQFCVNQAMRLRNEALSHFAALRRAADRQAKGQCVDRLMRKLRRLADDCAVNAILYGVAADLASDAVPPYDERKITKNLGSPRGDLTKADLRGLRERALAA